MQIYASFLQTQPDLGKVIELNLVTLVSPFTKTTLKPRSQPQPQWLLKWENMTACAYTGISTPQNLWLTGDYIF